jgi:ankyrin repeat protein
MKLLTYSDLDISKVKKQFAKVKTYLEAEDFRSADVKKMAQGVYHRAKLDDTNRLLLQFVRYQDQTVCLALEVILQHAYDKSRFLRGAIVDETKFVDSSLETVSKEASPVRYLNPKRSQFHLLDKVISFDDTQDSIYRAQAPIIIVGSAGSGKTALTLEKLRYQTGRVLYVTLSAFLAESARDLYFAHGYENDHQDTVFLSFKEFLETIQVPNGREVTFRDFKGFFDRHKQQFRFADAHQFFEEFKGVISSRPDRALTGEEYVGLGVRQSIFALEQRSAAYELFEKYRAWLQSSSLFDTNLVSHALQELATPEYDFIVIDEVQDLTNAQLALILKTLAKPAQFLLCGDSNQIVHPNFFNWSGVKSLFWADPKLAERQTLSVLQVNFRNAQDVTRVANNILKIKHARFGSIDKESNFLVEAVSENTGRVEFFADKDTIKRTLNEKTKSSTQFAVLVMRDEDKAEAKKTFQTPLVFSVHEAKGLEYPNIILHNFISRYRQTFTDITEDVTQADLEKTDLEYRRAKDKNDKSLEIYKFYINALYVAMTRAIEQVYMIEQDQRHPMLDLMGVKEGTDLQINQQASSRADWEREASKLELQGKLEQAAAIRSDILKVKPVPWEIWNVRQLETKSFDKAQMSSKSQKTMLEYAIHHRQYHLIERLHEVKFAPASAFLGANQTERGWQQKAVSEKYVAPFYLQNNAQILKNCDDYGVDYRLQIGTTPLMMAASRGNIPLLEALLERGANPALTDDYGHNTMMHGLNRALKDVDYASTHFSRVYELTAPHSLDVQVDGKLIRLYPHMAEYYFLYVMLTLCKTNRSAMHEQHSILLANRKLEPDQWLQMRKQYQHQILDVDVFNASDLQQNLSAMPENVITAARRKRSYFNHVLARAEVFSSYRPARKLWYRVWTGNYQINPSLQLRVKDNNGFETWQLASEVLQWKALGFPKFELPEEV